MHVHSSFFLRKVGILAKYSSKYLHKKLENSKCIKAPKKELEIELVEAPNAPIANQVLQRSGSNRHLAILPGARCSAPLPTI